MKDKSHKSHAMVEGPEAFDRFRKAMKSIITVRKSDALPALEKQPNKKPHSQHKR